MTEVKDVRAALNRLFSDGEDGDVCSSGDVLLIAFRAEGLKVCDDYERAHGPVDPISSLGSAAGRASSPQFSEPQGGCNE